MRERCDWDHAEHGECPNCYADRVVRESGRELLVGVVSVFTLAAVIAAAVCVLVGCWRSEIPPVAPTSSSAKNDTPNYLVIDGSWEEAVGRDPEQQKLECERSGGKPIMGAGGYCTLAIRSCEDQIPRDFETCPSQCHSYEYFIGCAR